MQAEFAQFLEFEGRMHWQGNLDELRGRFPG